MKKIAFVLMALLVMGTAQESMAQQRKAIAKRAAVRKAVTAKKVAAKQTTPSLAWEGPAVVDGHAAFLGVSFAELPAKMKTLLMAKGLKQEKRSWDSNNYYLTGKLDGTKSTVTIMPDDRKKVYSLEIIDDKEYTLAQARTRFNQLLPKIVAIYGKGTFGEKTNDFIEYVIKVGKETVNVTMFNGDAVGEAIVDNTYIVKVTFAAAEQ